VLSLQIVLRQAARELNFEILEMVQGRSEEPQMAIKDEIQWFKDQFAGDIVPALAGTPLSFDLICANRIPGIR
jgi:hypothetical protein